MHLVRDALPDARSRALVVALGNELRGDDAVGLEVARRVRGVRVVATEAEPTRLIDEFEGADPLVIVDAARSGGRPGTIHRIDLAKEELPAVLFRGSTHHLSLADTIGLARALGRLPERAYVVAIEGARFDAGAPLTPEVEAAIDAAVEEVERCTSGA
ncbi:MAG TPA: hydrogenase maturation protease [Gaiellaceae bacterium]